MFLVHLLTTSGHIGFPVVLYHTHRLADWFVFLGRLVFTAIAAVRYLATLVARLKTLPPEATGSTTVVRFVNFPSKLGLLFLVSKMKELFNLLIFSICQETRSSKDASGTILSNAADGRGKSGFFRKIKGR